MSREERVFVKATILLVILFYNFNDQEYDLYDAITMYLLKMAGV